MKSLNDPWQDSAREEAINYDELQIRREEIGSTNGG